MEMVRRIGHLSSIILVTTSRVRQNSNTVDYFNDTSRCMDGHECDRHTHREEPLKQIGMEVLQETKRNRLQKGWS